MSQVSDVCLELLLRLSDLTEIFSNAGIKFEGDLEVIDDEFVPAAATADAAHHADYVTI